MFIICQFFLLSVNFKFKSLKNIITFFRKSKKIKSKSINENYDENIQNENNFINNESRVQENFQFDINVKTIAPELISKNENIEIENIKTKVSLKALINKKFSIENLEISTKSLDAQSNFTPRKKLNIKINCEPSKKM